MSAEDLTKTLAAWKAVADAATEGPWLNGGQGWVFARGFRGHLDPQMSDLVATASTRDEDAEFIAQSRTIVPALLSAVEGMLALCDEREQELGDLLLPDLRALIRDVRKALIDALGGSR